MTNSSLLPGVWRWRQGLKDRPMHSHKEAGDFCKTRELYLRVENEEQAQLVIGELKKVGLELSSKRTHSRFDAIPMGSLIVFAATSLDIKNEAEEKNIKNLEKYILEHGGKIIENEQKVSVISGFFRNLFGGRK